MNLFSLSRLYFHLNLELVQAVRDIFAFVIDLSNDYSNVSVRLISLICLLSAKFSGNESFRYINNIFLQISYIVKILTFKINIYSS